MTRETVPAISGLLVAWGGTALLVSPLALPATDASSALTGILGQIALWLLCATVVGIVLLWEKRPQYQTLAATLGLTVRAALLLLGGLVTASAAAAESVVLGKGVSNAYAADVACTDLRACMQAVYVWEFDATRTITGPPVVGRARVLATQHTDATTKFVRSVEIFVVRPIDDPAVREAYKAEYYLVGLSPRYERSTYCLPVNPADIGLHIPSSEVTVEPDSGYYCFARRLVR